MTVPEFLVRLTRNQVRDLFAAARTLPAEKLTWKPAPGSRSALDQLQEVATAVDFNWSTYTDRRVEWSDEKAEQWVLERSRFTDLDELEQMAQSGTDRLAAFMSTLSDEDWSAPVEFPFESEFTLGDCLAYHFWNAAYHEGQITYIASLCEAAGEATMDK